MIEKNGDINIQDNFLAVEEFNILSERILHKHFPWYFRPIIVYLDEEISPGLSPGLFISMVYEHNEVISGRPYDYIMQSNIMGHLNCAVLSRVVINLNPINKEPFFSEFHSDTYADFGERISAQWTTSIFYINTNNGYTEIEQDGTKVESVANRVVTFPSNTRHRMVSQTDEQRRITINFNYLKYDDAK